MTLTYVYCLVRSSTRDVRRCDDGARWPCPVPRQAGAGAGRWRRPLGHRVIGAGARVRRGGARRAVCRTSIGSDAGRWRTRPSSSIFSRRPAVLPMQLFTLFTSDERALDARDARQRRRIDRILARVERQVEWGLRLSFDERAARQAVGRQPPVDATRRGAAGRIGAAYLARKRDLFDVTRVQLTAARTAADRLYRAMSREATEARRRRSDRAGGAGFAPAARCGVPRARHGAPARFAPRCASRRGRSRAPASWCR